MKYLFVFDMDGTLLPGTTANLELAKPTNTIHKLEVLETEFRNGSINTKGFAQHIFKLWGVLDPVIIEKAFINAPKLQNIKRVLEFINNNNGVSCLITMSPDFFANLFFPYGFDYIYSSVFPSVISDELDLKKILIPEDKPVIVNMLSQKLGIKSEHIYAFGDSMSDYPLFETIQNSIAVNGNLEICKKAKYFYNGNDLLEAYEQLTFT